MKIKQSNPGPARERYLGGKFLQEICKVGDRSAGRVADPTVAGAAMQEANAGPR